MWEQCGHKWEQVGTDVGTVGTDFPHLFPLFFIIFQLGSHCSHFFKFLYKEFF
jgi:hypothetical protein